METRCIESGGGCLTCCSPCQNSHWKDSGGYLSRKVTLKSDTEPKVYSEKEIELQSDIDGVIADIENTFEGWVVDGLRTVSEHISNLPSYFFTLMLQRIDEGRQGLPDEDSFFVNSELIAKYPEKYQVQRIGMQVSSWFLALGS